MMPPSPQNPNSHLTAKERKWPSFPTKNLFTRGLITGQVLDFGAGFGADTRFLKSQGLEATAYDPHYAPHYPTQKFDTILCNYVLNVLLPEEQPLVLMAVAELLKPTGKAYFSVRRDIKNNGFRTHLKHECKVYQCGVFLPYKSVFKNEHCEIYEYQHLNQQNLSSPCAFCAPSASLQLITETAKVYAVFAPQPQSRGHALIIPKHHCADYFDLPERSKMACWLVAEHVRQWLMPQFQPTGFNIHINLGNLSEAAASHVHLQLLPVYSPPA